MKKILVFLIASLIWTSAIFSQSLMSVKEVVAAQKDANVVLVSARKPADYAKSHAKGAVNVNVSGLNKTEPVKGMLKDANTVAATLGKAGINPSKKVILYCNTGVNAGRLYWVLRYLGCTDVHMMNGHMKAWFAGRKPVTPTPTKPKPVTFTPKVNKNLICDKSYVKANLNNSKVVMVDLRSKEDYDKGHIGKAVSLPHKQLLTADNKIKSKEALTALLNKAGITSDKEVILYCKTSTRAGLLFFILDAMLGYKNVKVYDGAYNEWAP